MRFVGTKDQVADVFTKGSFSGIARRDLFRVFLQVVPSQIPKVEDQPMIPETEHVQIAKKVATISADPRDYEGPPQQGPDACI